MRAYKIDGEIKSLEDEKTEIYEKIMSVGSTYNEVRVQSSPKSSSSELYDVLEEYTQKIERKKERLLKIKAEVLDAISRVDNSLFRQLLTLRYIRFYSWESVAYEVHYEPEYVRGGLHDKALKKIGEILNLAY